MASHVEAFMDQAIAKARQRAQRTAARIWSAQSDVRPVRVQQLLLAQPFVDAPEEDEIEDVIDDDEDDDSLREAYIREQRRDAEYGVPVLDPFGLAKVVCRVHTKRLRDARLGDDAGTHPYEMIKTMQHTSPVWERAFDVVAREVPALMQSRMMVTLESPANEGARVSFPMTKVMASESEFLSFLVHLCMLPAVRAGKIAAYVYDFFSVVSRKAAEYVQLEMMYVDVRHVKLDAGDVLQMLQGILDEHPLCTDRAEVRIEFV